MRPFFPQAAFQCSSKRTFSLALRPKWKGPLHTMMWHTYMVAFYGFGPTTTHWRKWSTFNLMWDEVKVKQCLWILRQYMILFPIVCNSRSQKVLITIISHEKERSMTKMPWIFNPWWDVRHRKLCCLANYKLVLVWFITPPAAALIMRLTLFI